MTPVASPLSSITLLFHLGVILFMAVYKAVRPEILRLIRKERRIYRGIMRIPTRTVSVLNPMRYWQRV